ncbi:MAG: hypothetical protein WAO00_07255 [Chthoniobacterales bacterium]
MSNLSCTWQRWWSRVLVNFGDLNPEAVLVYGEKGSERVQVLSDDAFRSAFLEIQP